MPFYDIQSFCSIPFHHIIVQEYPCVPKSLLYRETAYSKKNTKRSVRYHYYINPSHTFLYFYVLVFLWSPYYHNNNNTTTTFETENTVSQLRRALFKTIRLIRYSKSYFAIGSFQQLLLQAELCALHFDDSITKEDSYKIPLNKTLCTTLLYAFFFFLGIEEIYSLQFLSSTNETLGLVYKTLSSYFMFLFRFLH